MKQLAIIFHFVFFILICINVNAQNSNITISTSPTTGGDWVVTGTGIDLTYTFTPNSNSANLNNTDIVNRLYGATGYTIGNVTINTNNPTGTEAGNLTMSSEIRNINRSTDRYFLQIIAAGDMLINGSFEMSAYNSPLTANCNNIILTAGGNISLIGRINLIPESAYRDNTTLYSSSGNITINANGFVKVANTIKADGNYNSGNQGAYEYSHGGNISITGLNGVSISSDITSFPYGGSSGTITVNSGNATVTTNGINNGQTAGVFYCSSLYKKGSGVFAVKSANTILYNTNINNGTLKIISPNTIPIANRLIIDAGGTLDMNGINYTCASLDGGGNVISSSSGNLTFTSGANGDNTTFSGAFNETAAVLNIVKAGSGKLILAGSSNYTGTTSVNAGTINIQNDGALGTSSMLTLNLTGTILELESSPLSPINIESTPVKIYGGTSYPNEYGSLRNISGNNTWSSNIILNGNSFINCESGTFIVNSISGTTSNLLFTGNGGTIYASGTINIGTSNLSKLGSNTLVLQKENFYSGLTSISGGIVKIENEKVFGTTTQIRVSNSGSLELEKGLTITGIPLYLTAYGLNNTGGLRNITGTNTWNGPITFATPTARINSDDGILLLPNTLNGITNNEIINFGGNGIISIDGNIGSGFITRDGLGTLKLNAANTTNGETTLASGTVELTIENAVANSNINFNGGILKTTGTNQNFQQLKINDNSIIDLASTSHTLSFASEGAFALKRLLIKGWQGAYDGTAGTMGIIKIGNSAIASKEFLDQIRFVDLNNNQFNTTQLNTGESVPYQDIKVYPTRNSNISISNAPTFGGKWSSNTVGSVVTYTFMPYADNANILSTDIVNRLTGNGFTPGNVTIKTTNTTGIKNITTNGEFTFNSTKFINKNGALKPSGEYGLTHNGVIVTASTGTQLGTVFINQDMYGYNRYATSYTFKIEASGSIMSFGIIGFGSSVWDLNYSGNHIDFNAGMNISLSKSISTQGQSPAVGGGTVKSNGGNINLTAGENIKIITNANLIASGGYDVFPGYIDNTLSNGGNISITAGNGITIKSNIDASSGYIGKGLNGNVKISNGNTTITPTGGINEGLSSGIIKGGNLIKEGLGTIALNSLNTYNGTTTINAGTLQLGINNSIPVATSFKLNGGTFNTGGYNQTVASITLADNTAINFSNTTANTFTVNAISSFTTGKTLTINNWDGTYAAPGSTGNYGKLIINGTALTSALLSQIKFYNSTDLTIHSALQLGTKEIVAGN